MRQSLPPFSVYVYGMSVFKFRKIAFGREPFNGYSHLFAAFASIIGGIILLWNAEREAMVWLACVIYSVCLFMAFFSSALYHLVIGSPAVVRRLRDLDHLCIRGLIIGTYSPLAVRMLPPGWAIFGLTSLTLLTIVDAIISTRQKAMSRHRIAFSYISLATLSLIAVPFIWAEFWKPILCTSFGSLFYILGAVCYLKKIPARNRWMNFHGVWHICVILAALVHFLVILQLVQPT